MSEWFDLALMPFQFPFMQKAYLAVILVSFPMALLSCYVVLKGWSLMGDAIAHAVFPGVVIAYLLNIPFLIGAFAAGMFCAISTGFLKENSRVKEDTILGIVFSGMFAFGIVLYLKIETDVHLDHILYGNMLGVSYADLLQAAIIGLICAGFVLIKRLDLLALSFDEQHARAIGLPTRWLHYGLLAAISLSVVGALSTVGLILSIAYLIAPGAVAFLFTRTFRSMLLIASIVAIGCSVGGVYLSFWLDSAPAPTIVLLMSAVFVFAFVWAIQKTKAASKVMVEAAS
ncbi:metal ABC transporter permease [Cohaesibacter gelatinilyticus]|uniref:Manganese/iron transport system permease protein n=1 Tax=Cohaesibacter gelatinilyticus TaxID=372072 RepID=A0A285PI92_9HYPH|nr:metal ABC transporter permease [Cohaesibacter gelatinilyticus]SNZ20993.1 manganese/iron transport system permease protein [Cohaesibacter gelatinilyticus]